MKITIMAGLGKTLQNTELVLQLTIHLFARGNWQKLSGGKPNMYSRRQQKRHFGKLA